MAQPLREYFGHVRASDIFDYGYAEHIETADYLCSRARCGPRSGPSLTRRSGWPQQFVAKSFDTPGWLGTACIVRSAFLEGGDRYRTLFSVRPPSIVAQHVERVIMTKGIVRDPAKEYWDEKGAEDAAPLDRDQLLLAGVAAHESLGMARA
jgi:hypothetical protein